MATTSRITHDPEACAEPVASARKRYLERLKCCKDQGIRILIDGREQPEPEWSGLFGVSEDGGFYMADFVTEAQGLVREIRFDRVYVKSLLP